MTYEGFKGTLVIGLNECFEEETLEAKIGKEPDKAGGEREYLYISDRGRQILSGMDLAGLYAAWKDGTRSYDDILDGILKEAREKDGRDTLLQEVLESVYLSLVNRERGGRHLEVIAHKDFLDLAIVLYVQTEAGKTMLLTAPMLELWQTDFDTLYAAAVRNSEKKRPYCLCDLKDLACTAAETKSWEHLQVEDRVEKEQGRKFIEAAKDTFDSGKAFLLTGADCRFRAACILYPDVLKDLSDRLEKDIYILFPSVDEALLIPEDNGEEKPLLEQMSASIRGKEDGEGWLSGHIYRFSRRTGQIVMEQAETDRP